MIRSCFFYKCLAIIALYELVPYWEGVGSCTNPYYFASYSLLYSPGVLFVMDLNCLLKLDKVWKPLS